MYGVERERERERAGTCYGVPGARTKRIHEHRELYGVERERELAHVTVSSVHVHREYTYIENCVV